MMAESLQRIELSFSPDERSVSIAFPLPANDLLTFVDSNTNGAFILRLATPD